MEQVGAFISTEPAYDYCKWLWWTKQSRLSAVRSRCRENCGRKGHKWHVTHRLTLFLLTWRIWWAP